MGATTTEAASALMTAHLHQALPILGAMEIEVLEAARGRATARLPLGPNRNHVGTAYAGSLFSVAEVLGGVLALSTFTLEGYAPIVKSMTIDYLKPARGDVRACAEMHDAEIDRVSSEAAVKGKADYTLSASIVDDAGVTVATTTAQYQLRRLA